MNKVFHIKDRFLKSISLLVLLLIVHFMVIAIDSGLPLALLYGPALYYSHLALQLEKPKRGILVGLAVPFIVLSIGYVILRISGVSFEEMGKHYYPIYFAFMILSLLILPILVLIQKYKWEISSNHLRPVLVQQLAVVSIAIALSITMVFINTFYDLDFDIHPRSMIMMLMALTLIILSRYLYQENPWKEHKVGTIVSLSSASNDAPSYSLPEELLKDYAARIQYCLFEEELYLDPSLSVDILAQETKIPKHHFSELFNAYLGKSFYQLIAEYRIKKAMYLIEAKGHSMTIEALAYECGFNSKTSFNKHFKEINGSLPSEFRDRQLA